MVKITGWLSGSIAVFLLIPQIGFADEVSDLKSQVEELRKQNQTLQEQVNKQQAVTDRLLTKIEAIERTTPPLPREASAASETLIATDVGREVGPPSLIDVPRLHIRGFADAQFNAKWTGSNKHSDSIVLGAVDLYTTSQITDQVSMLMEADFNSDSDTNAATFRLERAVVKYSLSDLFNVRMGRMHTPIGYWNQAYHHGNWLQTTINRPDIALHEAENGAYLPVHQIGIDFSGAKDFDDLGEIGYNVGIFNGRGRTITEVQHVKDKNASKAVNLHLSLKPRAVEGLTLGTDVWYDTIPANPSVSTRVGHIRELIVGGYATYYHKNAELLAELFDIVHDDKTSGEEFDTLGFYLQGGYRFEKLMPYYRLDFVDVANSDPFFTTPRNIDRTRHTLGLRWDFVPWNAVKMEYSYAGLGQGDDEQALNANWSFAF